MVTVSTSAFYEGSAMGIAGLRQRAERLQASVGSGERLARGSDDPVAAARLRALNRAESFAAIDTTNAARIGTDLALTDNALSSFAVLAIRAKELAVQAASGHLSTAQRGAIGTELEQLHTELIHLANSRDSAGHALFGGMTSGAAYTVDPAGNPTYAGTAGAGQLALDDDQTIARGLTGPEFLNFAGRTGSTTLFATVRNLADALGGGVIDPAQAARDTLGMLDAGLETITTAQTMIGARMGWIELVGERRTQMTELRSQDQADIGGTDLAAAVTELQQVMTVLEASQASFARLASLSLFDILR